MREATRNALEPAAIAQRLRAQFGDDIPDAGEQFGHATVTVTPARYHEVAEFLRDDPDLALDFFDFTGGVDLGEQGLQVVTHLYSTVHNHHVRLKVACDREKPVCPTLSDVYAGAD